MLNIQGISYSHTNKDLLFEHLDLNIQNQQKLAIIGNNGVGKSTFLKILSGELLPSSGNVICNSIPYYIPQLYGQYDELTIAEALRVDIKLMALKEIMDGNVSDENMDIIGHDWNIEEQILHALELWNLSYVNLLDNMGNLSGGEKTKIFLAGINIHQPDIILMDEPSNHLDVAGRELLYDLIEKRKSTIIVVSHDRVLLNKLSSIGEMYKNGLQWYGGNYDFYKEQKSLELNALNEHVKSKEKALRKAKVVERDAMERQQKLDSRGKKKQEKAGLPTISMNTLRNKAENSTAQLKSVHTDKLNSMAEDLQKLRSPMSRTDKMKFDFDNSTLYEGKTLIKATEINFAYHGNGLWQSGLNFTITSGSRIAIRGVNGSGKTTLIKILLAQLMPTRGEMAISDFSKIYIDQEYSIINDTLNVFEQAELYNITGLEEHDIRIRLARFLFNTEYLDRSCSELSGGEKMRLLLCCLSIQNRAPDMIILDEPTNNLDIQNLEILTSAIRDYQGALIVVSHDAYFLKEINAVKVITL